MKYFQKQIDSFFYDQITQEIFVEGKFGFLWKSFSISPLKLAFQINMEGNAAVMLQFEDLTVKNYLFKKNHVKNLKLFN